MKRLKVQTKLRELSSVGSEHLPYKQRVDGSNPSVPTENQRVTTHKVVTLFYLLNERFFFNLFFYRFNNLFTQNGFYFGQRFNGEVVSTCHPFTYLAFAFV